MATPKIARKNAKRAMRNKPSDPSANFSGGPGAGKPPKKPGG